MILVHMHQVHILFVCDFYQIPFYNVTYTGHFRYPPSAASSLARRSDSPAATPMSPRTALAEAQEFIDVAEEIDLSNDPGGRTALHLAIVHKHTKVIDILLNHKGEKTVMANL